jgi:hypothetical protein
MPLFALIPLTVIVSGLGFAVTLLALLDEYLSQRQKIATIIPCLLVPAALCCWLVSTRTQEFKIVGEQMYALETVTNPNGTLVQVIVLDGVTRVNITEEQKRFFPPGTAVVREQRDRTINGIFFDSSDEYRNRVVWDVPTTQPATKGK